MGKACPVHNDYSTFILFTLRWLQKCLVTKKSVIRPELKIIILKIVIITSSVNVFIIIIIVILIMITLEIKLKFKEEVEHVKPSSSSKVLLKSSCVNIIDKSKFP